MEIKILRNILSDNMHCAQVNNRTLKKKNILSVNLMASPGAGKTSFIVNTIQRLKGERNICVIEGDIESSIDAQKLSDMGIHALQINTGGGCHLDANMIGHAIEEMDIPQDSILIIENVGNLVCTAAFDLGEDLKVVILSCTEGHDKPYKYPKMFEIADVVILNKVDLLPYIDFSRDSFYNGVRALNEKCQIFEISCKDGTGIDEWVNWIRNR